MQVERVWSSKTLIILNRGCSLQKNILFRFRIGFAPVLVQTLILSLIVLFQPEIFIFTRRMEPGWRLGKKCFKLLSRDVSFYLTVIKSLLHKKIGTITKKNLFSYTL
ncbi:hypothetical protein B14911_17010 [Bacillus sp. NRRL B-14911]|uniref:Uncharacterized protein n=1 Tax=Bacillus infantis NRRL B-14911 TaxID=1367477 RepID=U5L5T4_9BACI|nr:hypothetical protein N288_03925 [Bacillus infantis NRRL B-14911]EAR67233.1 hypothetical protein B14911_17010 [Bacillus sp. NRRL B-14911]